MPIVIEQVVLRVIHGTRTLEEESVSGQPTYNVGAIADLNGQLQCICTW